jgi:hypothetical protein
LRATGGFGRPLSGGPVRLRLRRDERSSRGGTDEGMAKRILAGYQEEKEEDVKGVYF